MSCNEYAVNVYLSRANGDTGPRIVRMLLPDGIPDDHWYYKSDQVISTSEVALVDARLTDSVFGPFEGTINSVPPIVMDHFLDSRCETDEIQTQLASTATARGHRTYIEYL